MNNESLFGHISERFGSTQLENIATEALAYIISRTKSSKKTFLNYLEAVGIEFDAGLSIRTQAAGEDGSIPDMIGKDGKGNEILAIESKFWAGLTDNQPNAYLKRFPEKQRCLLLFIAPEVRFQTLWSELLRRVVAEGMAITRKPNISSQFYLAEIEPSRLLGLVSWRALLSSLLRTFETEEMPDAVSDVKQLIGLCEKQDRDAILPFSSEELCSTHGRRIADINKLINKVTGKLVEKEIGTIKNIKATGYENVFGRYIRILDQDWFIHSNARYWAVHRETPVWLTITGIKWKTFEELPENLRRLERNDPPGIFFDNKPIIPLFIPIGEEEDRIVDSLFNQIMAIVEAVKA